MPSPEYTVDLIRHAESAMNVAMADPNTVPFIGGRENHIELSLYGEDQARALGHYALDNDITPTQLYCSPAIRSQRTCQLSAEALGLRLPFIVDERLQELDQGMWTNQPRALYDDPLNQAAIQAAGRDFAPPGGQSMNAVANQLNDFLKSLDAVTEDGEHVWVHTHGVAIKSWLAKMYDWPHDRTYKTVIDNVSISRLIVRDGVCTPQFVNKSTVPA